jgi:hypothetical protein
MTSRSLPRYASDTTSVSLSHTIASADETRSLGLPTLSRTPNFPPLMISPSPSGWVPSASVKSLSPVNDAISTSPSYQVAPTVVKIKKGRAAKTQKRKGVRLRSSLS